MASLTTSRAGMGSAFTDLTRDFGGAVVNAVMGSALAIAYTSSLSTALGKLSPAQAEQLGSQAAQQIVSRFYGGLAVAERYPPTPASQILTAASMGSPRASRWPWVSRCYSPCYPSCSSSALSEAAHRDGFLRTDSQGEPTRRGTGRSLPLVG